MIRIRTAQVVAVLLAVGAVLAPGSVAGAPGPASSHSVVLRHNRFSPRTPTASHIHKGARGNAGPIVIAFFVSPPAKHSGCVSAPKSAIAAIIKSPGGYYVNVHTKDYPAGAIRGQL